MSFFNRETPPIWRIILYCVLSLLVLLALGRLGAYFQIG